MRLNSKNGINGLTRKLNISSFNPNKALQYKILNLDYNKTLTLPKDEKPELKLKKSPKSISNHRNIKTKEKVKGNSLTKVEHCLLAQIINFIQNRIHLNLNQ